MTPSEKRLLLDSQIQRALDERSEVQIPDGFAESVMARIEAAFVPPEYDVDLDFDELALLNSDFNDCLKSNKGRFDWKNAEHLRCVFECICLSSYYVFALS